MMVIVHCNMYTCPDFLKANSKSPNTFWDVNFKESQSDQDTYVINTASWSLLPVCWNARMIPITWHKFKWTPLFKYSLDFPHLNLTKVENDIIIWMDIIKLNCERTWISPIKSLIWKWSTLRHLIMNIGHDHLDHDPITLVINKRRAISPSTEGAPFASEISVSCSGPYWSLRAVSGNIFVLLSAKAEHQIGCCASRNFANLTSWWVVLCLSSMVW